VSQLCFNPLSIPLRTTGVDLLAFWGGGGGDILRPVLKNKSNVRRGSRIQAGDISVRCVKRDELDLDDLARRLIRIAKAQVLAQQATSHRTGSRTNRDTLVSEHPSGGRGGDAAESVRDPGQ